MKNKIKTMAIVLALTAPLTSFGEEKKGISFEYTGTTAWWYGWGRYVIQFKGVGFDGKDRECATKEAYTKDTETVETECHSITEAYLCKGIICLPGDWPRPIDITKISEDEKCKLKVHNHYFYLTIEQTCDKKKLN